MSDDAPEPDAPEALDDFVGRAEQRMRLLEELALMGMGVAGALQRKAVAEAELAEIRVRQAQAGDDSEYDIETAPGRDLHVRSVKRAADLAAAFDRVSRSVRLTLALAARTDESLRALLAGEPARVEAKRAATARRESAERDRRQEARRDRVSELVRDVADREVETDEALGDVFEALEERLAEDPAYQDLDAAPLKEVVRRLCEDLQLTPDWSRWTGDGWSPPEPFHRPKSSPFHRPGRKPTDSLAETLAETLAEIRPVHRPP